MHLKQDIILKKQDKSKDKTSINQNRHTGLHPAMWGHFNQLQELQELTVTAYCKER